jgi:hypothetical protein
LSPTKRAIGERERVMVGGRTGEVGHGTFLVVASRVRRLEELQVAVIGITPQLRGNLRHVVWQHMVVPGKRCSSWANKDDTSFVKQPPPSHAT